MAATSNIFRPTVLVLLDSPTPEVTEVRPVVLEAICAGREIGRVDVVTLGAPSVSVLATLGSFGVASVHQAALPASVPTNAHRLTFVMAAVLVAAVRRIHADLLLTPSSFAAKEAAAVAALRLGAGFVWDATGVAWRDDKKALRVTKSPFAGAWEVAAQVLTDPAVVTLLPNAAPPTPAERATQPEVLALPIDLDVPPVTVESRELRGTGGGRPELEDAQVVVAGGRGTNGDFAPVFDLADALGAAVGATRDAVFDGWFDRYIGSTGVTVAPRLFVSAGISGAPYHTGGMQASKTIVAVNNDAEAPIFEICDFGVVGDLAAVLPAAAAAIRAHQRAES